MTGHSGAVEALAFSRDERVLYSAKFSGFHLGMGYGHAHRKVHHTRPQASHRCIGSVGLARARSILGASTYAHGTLTQEPRSSSCRGTRRTFAQLLWRETARPSTQRAWAGLFVHGRCGRMCRTWRCPTCNCCEASPVAISLDGTRLKTQESRLKSQRTCSVRIS